MERIYFARQKYDIVLEENQLVMRYRFKIVRKKQWLLCLVLDWYAICIHASRIYRSIVHTREEIPDLGQVRKS